MKHGTSFKTPNDAFAAIVAGEEAYWGFEIGVQNPTGGLYANTADMDIWMRYVLSSFNAHAHGALNWFNPVAYSGGLRNFYGLPWEIMRVKTEEMSEKLAGSKRALTLVTKGGGLPAYSSDLILVPELGIGVTLLVAGQAQALNEIREVVVRELAEVAESAAIAELRDRYVGIYEDGRTGTKMELRVSEENGLYVETFFSRGIDVRKNIETMFTGGNGGVVLHVVPLQLYIEEKKQKGERWRVVMRKTKGKTNSIPNVWDELCVEDWQTFGVYGVEYMSEIIFWEFKENSAISLQLPAYRDKLSRVAATSENAEDLNHVEKQKVLEL